MQIDPEVRKRWDAAAAGREAEIAAAGAALQHAVLLMAHLRSASGCPWDREQSLASLRQYVREEADEVCNAIDRILEFEAGLRASAGLPAANPDPPQGADQARTAKKGWTIAHHPHHPDFAAAQSASGAPLPAPLSTADQAELDQRYRHLAEELGDLLLQPVFQADILQAMGRQTIPDIIDALVEKLIRRHPHVYGEIEVTSSAEVLANWEQIKRGEKPGGEPAEP